MMSNLFICQNKSKKNYITDNFFSLNDLTPTGLAIIDITGCHAELGQLTKWAASREKGP